MNVFQYFVLITLLSCLIIAIITSYRLRYRLTKMQAMVISMSLGMNIGLTAGALFGSYYQGDLYKATLISIGVGALSGIGCGISFGILQSMEGFMSGLMGGMMGAMLGAMISYSELTVIINVMLLLTVSSLLLFLILPDARSHDNFVKNKKWFWKPLISFLALFSFLFFGNQMSRSTGYFNSSMTDHSDHDTHQNQQGMKKIQSKQITVNVQRSTFAYTPAKILLNKNEPVTIILDNADQVDHDIEIKEISIQETLNKIDSKINTDLHLHSSADSKSELTFTPLKEGTYEFYCSIPGHKENGMIGTLIVT